MSITTHLTMSIEVLRRASGAVNEYGEASDTWSTVATFAGLIQPGSGKFQREDGGIMKTSTHNLFCLVGANIKEGDKVKFNDEEYDVLFIGDEAGKAHHYLIELIKKT